MDYCKHKIYHYTSNDPKKRANAAYLMGAYLVIVKGKTGDEAYSFFENIYPPFKPFRDSLQGECSFACTVYLKII
jgi:cell division cycle 14